MHTNRCHTLLFAIFLAPMCAALAETPPEQVTAIKALRGAASNLQKNRDGTVRFIRFSKAIVTDKHLEALRAFKQLDYLAVVGTKVTDAGLENAAELNNLDTIYLWRCNVTDAAVSVLSNKPKLERLYLDATKITDKGLAKLKGVPKLHTLSLDDTAVSDQGLKALTELDELQVLRLRNTKVTDTGIGHLLRFKKLKTLYLDGTQLTSAAVAHLSKLTELETLSLNRTKVDKLESTDLPKKLKSLLLVDVPLSPKALADLKQELPKLNIAASPTQRTRQTPFERFLSSYDQNKTHASKTSARPTVETAIAKPARVRFIEGNETPDFQRHVIPLLSRLGCSGRNCHGSFQGRGGFRLSMFGYDFRADHKSMTEADSGRVNVKAATDSLILRKPTLLEDHEGGKRFKANEWEYTLLRRWIEGGAKGPHEPLARLRRLEITPQEIVFDKPSASQQIRVVAVWEDGRREDVTCLTRFETNDDSVATSSKQGVITSRGRGDTHVICYYDNAVEPVAVMTPVNEKTRRNYPQVPTPTTIDKHIVTKLSKLGIVPSPVCSDEEFLRRVGLDLVGTLPTPDEIQQFVADSLPDKRSRKIKELLDRPAYVEWWTNFLCDLTGTNAQFLGSTDMNQPAAGQWTQWMRQRIRDNVGWHEIAAGIILAKSRSNGETYQQYAARQSLFTRRKQPDDFGARENPMHYYWFRSNLAIPTDRALSFGYVFLGVRLQCAQCHKHPFDQWSKQDFESFTSFFTRIRTGIAPDASQSHQLLMNKLGVPKKLDTAALRRQMYMRVAAEGQPIPWKEVYIQPLPAGQKATAKLLAGEEIDLSQFGDPREPLMNWLASPSNPYFARAFVNRVWARYFHRGIVEPADDLNRANPPANKELLDYLATEFVRQGYDMKWLHRTITSSATYQRSWMANTTNKGDERNFSRAVIRRLPAEVVIDSILQSTASDAQLKRLSLTTDRRKIAQHPKSIQTRGIDYSLLVFGKPLRSTNCDCERQMQPTLLQSLYVRNDNELLSWLERPDGWLQQIARQLGTPLAQESDPVSVPGRAKPKRTLKKQPKPTKPTKPVSDDQLKALVDSAYVRTLCRRPNEAERRRALDHLKNVDQVVEGLRDLMWVLVNTKEFLTNH